jgi:hypothetical protein
MTDVETKLRTGLGAYATETAAVVSRPSVASIELRAGDPPTVRRRWARLVAAVAAATVATTSAAAAVGVLPGPVESMLEEFRSTGFDATEGAQRMASVTTGNLTYEVWTAPLGGGGECVFDRVVGPEVDEFGSFSHCRGEPSAPRSRGRFGELTYPEAVFENSAGHDPASAPRHAVSSGQLPIGATEVVFEFDDGTTLAVAPQREGFFITTFPGVRDGSRIIEVRALDADGHVVATS